jgi:hypothetical protein
VFFQCLWVSYESALSNHWELHPEPMVSLCPVPPELLPDADPLYSKLAFYTQGATNNFLYTKCVFVYLVCLTTFV